MFLPRFDETPDPLIDADGIIRFPGFPADLLAEFRVDALLTQAIMWSVVGVVFILASQGDGSADGGGPCRLLSSNRRGTNMFGRSGARSR